MAYTENVLSQIFTINTHLLWSTEEIYLLSLYITRSLLRPKIHSDKITKGSTSRKDLLLTVHAAAFGPPSAA